MIYERFRNEFASLSSTQLLEVDRALKEAVESRRKQEVESLRNEMSRKAAELGLDLRDLVSGKSVSKKAGRKVGPKYRITSPDGTVHEWSGRGIRPKAFAPYSKEELESRFLIRN